MDVDTVLATFFVLAFFAIHLASRRLEHLPPDKLSLIMSVAGGVAAAYVFLHLLPELGHREEALVAAVPSFEGGFGIYLLALVGLMVFFGIERLVVGCEEASEAAGGEKEVGPLLFWSHVGAFAFNSFVIGHLLIEWEDLAGIYPVLYGMALALHFMTNDHALRLRHDKLHQRHGRWVLAGAVVLGWIVGLAGLLPPAVVAGLFAVLAGGIIFNVMKEELPAERDGSFTAFVAGAAGYALLLAAVHNA